MFNHFEFHAEITTKDGLLKNMLEYTQRKKLCVFDYVPLTFAIDLDEEARIPEHEKFIQCYNIIDSAIKSTEKDEPASSVLTRINTKLQSITFVKDKRGTRAKICETHFAGKNLWILKPTGLNRGRGVSVFDSLEKFKALIREYSEGVPDEGQTVSPILPIEEADSGGMSNLGNLPSVIKTRTFVIQKYVERPLLIHERKFDIRCWVLVTQEMKLYWFKEGYIRTSSSSFTMDSSTISKRDIHLTNNAVQKYCDSYGRFEEGNQLSFPQFQVRDFASKTHIGIPEHNIPGEARGCAERSRSTDEGYGSNVHASCIILKSAQIVGEKEVEHRRALLLL